MKQAFANSTALEGVRTPATILRLTRLMAVGLCILPFVLLMAPWQQNVRGEGQVSAYAPLERRQTVEAPIDGRIVRWWVAEGSEVKAGDPLFEVTDNDPLFLERMTQQLKAGQAKLEAYQAKARSYDELMQATSVAQGLALTAASERIEMSEEAVLAAEKAVEAAEIKEATAQLNFDRRSELRGDGLASQREWELARLEVRQAKAEKERRQAELRAAKSNQDARIADRGKVQAEFEGKLRSARAQRETALSEAASAESSVLDKQVKLARQQTQRVTAPLDGTVFRLAANQGGEMVHAGDPVMDLVPSTEVMAAELWVDGNDMPLLSEGRKVRLQFEGWPAVQFAGWPSVAVGTFGGVVRLIDPTDDGAGRFRVLIKPDPDEPAWPSRRFLRQGVQVRGWILLEEVSIGFELWRNINGFPPVIADAEPTGRSGQKKKKKKKKGKN